MIQIPRRFTALLAVFLLLPSLALPAQGAGEPRPQLEDLSLDRDTVSPGGRIQLGGQAWAGDGEMGPIQLFFEHRSSGRVLMATLRETRDPGGDGPPPSQWDFSGSLAIPGDASAGEYRLIRVVLRDSAGGSLRLENRSSYRDGEEPLDIDLSFTVLEELPLSSPVSCTVSPADAQPGDTVQFRVFSQAGSLLHSASAIFRERGGSHSLSCSLSRQSGWVDDQTLEGDLELPEQLPAGIYELASLTLTDASGSRQTYSSQGGKDLLPLPVSCSLSVSGQGGDTSSPVLESVSIGEASQEDGDWIYPVSAAVRDSGSGVEHITIRFENAGKDSVSAVLYGDGTTEGTLHGELKVASSDPAGPYSLKRITLADQVGNRSYYAPPEDCRDGYLPLPQVLSFQHREGAAGADDTPPVLQSVTLEEHTIQQGEAILVTALAQDGHSGVKKVQLQFREEGGRSVNVTLEADQDGELTGWVKKYQTKTPGRYRLTRAVVSDLAGNRRIYRDNPGQNEESLPFSTGFTVEE